MKKTIYLTALLAFSVHSIAQTPALNQAQDEAIKALLAPYSECVSADIVGESSAFSQGVSLVLREQHLPQCWEGKGDPNTSPVFMHADIDRFGRVFEANVIEGGNLTLLTPTTDSHKTIDDIANWSHPTKAVFAKYGIEVLRLELLANNTYPIFTVADNALFNNNLSEQQRQTRENLFKALIKANAQWDFAITTDSGQQFFIEGKKRKVPDVKQLKIQ